MELGRVVAGDWLGRQVTVVVDRPLGSLHPNGWFRYPVNYGYVPGFVAPDGEELDAYLLGPAGPVEEASGTVVAVVVRRDDVEDKLVVATAGVWSKEDIEAAVRFTEQHFDVEIVVAGDLG